jgi:hypothetical protein
MRRLLLVLLTAVLCVGLATPQSAAQTIVSGRSSGGAYYQIAVPDAWNGDLVIWNHGFSLDPIAPDPDLGPLVDLQLAEGYAVAASSYRQIGWAVFKTKNDLQNLYAKFVSRFGHPSQVLVYGASLGGIVTAAAIERAHLGNVVGAYPVCGALAGSRNWDGALDFRLLYDDICGDVPGAFIPGGAEGLPEDSSLTPQDTFAAIDACFGLFLPPARTPDQQARLDRFLAISQVPENFILTDVGFFATFGMSDLVHSPTKLAGKLGTGNGGVDYGDPALNASVERVEPNPGAANRLEKHYTPTGHVGDVKIVSLHTDKDGLVLVENEHEYAEVIPPANLTTAIVVETVPSHCGFTGAELVAGWEALRGWVTGGPQPSAAAIQGLCQAVAPTFGGPCRIDPTFVVPDMDGRVRPR